MNNDAKLLQQPAITPVSRFSGRDVMHLLVIEDNSDLVANLYDFLEPRGYVVDAAYDARSGLRFAGENSYDAIILDLMLPDMDGLEVCNRLRDSGCGTPLLMLTARDTLDGFTSDDEVLPARYVNTSCNEV